MTCETTDPITRIDLRMKNRGQFTYEFIVRDVNGAAVDLTDYTAVAEFRDGPGGTLVHRSTTENFELIVDPASKVFFDIAGSEIEALTLDDMQYDVFVISPAGKPFPIAQGFAHRFESITEL